MPKIRLLPLLFASALLGACATGGDIADNTVVAAPVAEPPPPAPELPERAIPADSLHDLLVAEFALRRQQYGVALQRYAEQAPILRDAGVSAHTTHLAQYLRREPEALAAVKLWVELEPDNAEANYTLATLLTHRGETVAAVPHMAAAARAGKAVNFPLLASDFELLPPAQQDALIRELEALQPEFPGNTQLLIALAIMYEERGAADNSLTQLAQVFEREAFQPQAVLLEAKILQENGDSEPFKRMEEALEADPDNTRLRLQYARLLTRTDLTAARQQFEILSANNPSDPELLLSLALINRETENFLEARAYLRQLLSLGQRTDEAHYYLGRIAEDQRDLKEAVRHYSQVTDGREFLNANSRVGRILIDTGQEAEIHGYFNQLRMAYPQRREQLYGLEANLLGQAQRRDLAMVVLNQGLSELPEATSLQYARSMLGEQQGDMALMESDLRAIIAREPNNATALNALGYTLANRTERYAEAEDLISRALALQPNEPSILDSMGWVKFRLGDYAEAERYLRQAFAAFPDPEIAAHLGEVLWVKGDSREALDIWRSALIDNPQHTVLVDTLNRLGVDRATALAGHPDTQQ